MIKKGDTVSIISGKDRGKTGKVLRVFPKEGMILVDGVAVHKRHERPKKAGQKGEVVGIGTPIDSSNAMIFCKSCKKGVRVSYISGKNKLRACKKCNKEI